MDRLLIEYLLVPSVITVIIVYLAANAMLKGMNLGIHALVAITMYIVFIYSGFYAIFAPLMYGFMLFFILIIGVMVFFTTRVISPPKMAALGKVASKIAEKKADVKIIKRSLDVKTAQIAELDRMIDEMGKDIGKREYTTLKMMIHQAKTEKDILASQIHELEKYKDISSSESFSSQSKSTMDTLNNIDGLIREMFEFLRSNTELMHNYGPRVYDFERRYLNQYASTDKQLTKANEKLN